MYFYRIKIFVKILQAPKIIHRQFKIMVKSDNHFSFQYPQFAFSFFYMTFKNLTISVLDFSPINNIFFKCFQSL